MTNTPPPLPTPEGPSTPSVAPGERSFFARLFDLSFTEFVTPSLIKLIYVLGIIGAAIYGIAVLAAVASQGGGYIVLGLLLGGLVFFFALVLARVMAEIYLILFKIEENTRKT